MSEAKPYADADRLRGLYHGSGMTSSEIADKFGVSRPTILRYLRENGIRVRPRNGDLPDELDDFDWLFDRYVRKQQSCAAIAEELGVDDATVFRRLEESRIPLRRSGSSYTPIELRDGDALERLYDARGLSHQEIADRLDCPKSTVQEWVRAHGIETRTRGPGFGPDHHSWKGGKRNYGEGWTRKKRERVRDRDNRRCQACGEHERDLPKSLDVHHIIPVRQIDDPETANAASNLVALCSVCHKKWEGIPLKPGLLD